MGRPTSHSPLVITHFSHPHPLRLTAASYPSSATSNMNCVGCSLPAAASTSYSCSPCGFFLHFTCASLHPLLLHPCDPAHGLALLPSPPYSDGRYTCDACARSGTGFVYHCAACGLDIHTLCARALTTVSCSAHTEHLLSLAFTSPYGEGRGFTCDVCGRSGASREWLYRCDTCEFDVHLACGGGVVETPAVQMAHSVSYRGGATAVGGIGRGGEGFVGNVVQGFAAGLVQGIIGGGTGAGGGGEASGGGGAGFAVEMAQNIVGGIFGNSESGE